jgi:serine/threonine-protein kinase HipA
MITPKLCFFRLIQNERWELTPAYDICFAYRPGSEWVSQHNLSINGKRKDITLNDLLAVRQCNEY